MLRLSRTHTVAVASTWLLCAFVVVTATPTNLHHHQASINDTHESNSSSTTNNFNCPEDCQCVIAHNTHKPFLHAKCSSLNGLKSEAPLNTSLPVHSIDLSYLSLPRLSHSLEKLHDLTSIDLSHNELHEIGHLGRRIKKLNLKHNRITSSKLSKLPQHVQVLNLQHNDITNLPSDFTKLTHLQTLELSHNQINCSCETLDVRNWLQEHHVFMEHAVTCTYPVEVKGKPWLQVKQTDICDKEKSGRGLNDDENELMMGDQPVEGSGDTDDDDELGKAFMPIDKKSTTPQSNGELILNDVEGSGDLSAMNMPLAREAISPPLVLESSPEHATTETPTDEEEEDDGSGSGGGILIIPHLAHDHIDTDDFDAEDTHNEDDEFDKKPVEQPATEAAPSLDIFGAGMGIFDGKENTDKPVEEEAIVPVVHHNVETSNGQSDFDPTLLTDAPDGDNESEAIVHAKVGNQEDSNATYFLLGVILLIVIGLILYVGIKRCKNKRNAAHDAENQRQTELLDMDKKNLGKPINRNGNEHAPLIGEKTKSDIAKPINGANDKKPYGPGDVNDGPGQQQPLLNGNGTTNGTASNSPGDDITKVNAPTNELSPHEYHPITPRYPTPKSPRASKYAQYPQAGGEHNNNNSTEDAYLPSSPKSGRYSPVYSPETGRVKIKLTETPKPKTPMLVTRSKSNAGDIITTPVNIPTVHGQ